MLLNALREKVRVWEAEQMDVRELFAGFVEIKNQLRLVKNMELVLNWKPTYVEDVKGEVYPPILEMETNAFRRGPPGCELILRALMGMLKDSVLLYMCEQIEQDQVLFKFKFKFK